MARIVAHLVGVVASLLLVALVALTVVDVAGRNLLNRPLAGAAELTELALVGMSFLMYPLVSYKEKHITIDLFADLLSAAMQRAQRVLGALIGLAVFGGLSWRLWSFGVRASSYGDATIYLQIPIGPVFIFMSLLSAATAVAFILVIVNAMRGRGPSGEAEKR